MEPSQPEVPADHLDADLEDLVLKLHGEIARLEPITRLTSPRQNKAHFKMTLTDGRQFKARIYESRAKRQRFTSLAPLLDGLPFSRLIASEGRATLEEWVVGNPLQADAVTEQQGRDAGQLLGLLHTLDGVPGDAEAEIVGAHLPLERINRHLDQISRAAVELSPLCEKLAKLARESETSAFDWGLIHSDFSVDNMILDEDGQIIVVDNETLKMGPLDFDLARCWSRWPMIQTVRKAFIEGYQLHRSLESFNENRQFWAIRALVQSLAVHMNHGRTNCPVLEALRHLVAGETEHIWPRIAPGD